MPESWRNALSWTLAVGLILVAAWLVWAGFGLVIG